MFIPNIPAENTVLRSYLYNEKATTFENQYLILDISISTFLHIAERWKCPNFKDNRQILAVEHWKNEYQAFLAYGSSLVVNNKAQLCGTFYNTYGTSYLVWLEFTGPDEVMHRLDCFIRETDGNVTKVVDGISCEDVYTDITTKGYINPSVARKLNSIGSVTWDGTAESKTQYKLNSFRQQKLFEKVAAECSFVELKQLDCFDDFLYRGDPGRLADYDLTLILENGTRLTTRIDLKLLNDLNTLEEQKKKAHDAELLVASALLAPNIKGQWVVPPKHAIHIEDLDEFKDFMKLFKAALVNEPPQYIKIHNIEPDTGRVIYEFFN